MSTIDDIKKKNTAQLERAERYASLVKQIYDLAEQQYVQLAMQTNYDHKKQFFFEDYPHIMKKVNEVTRKLATDVGMVITRGTADEWNKAGADVSDMAEAFLKQIGIDDIADLTKLQYQRYFTNREDALNAYQQRREKGLNLSKRVWNLAEEQRLYTQLGISIADGQSAGEIARLVQQYLNEPDKLFRRVRDKYGELHLSRPAKAYHPGAGVYRSSYKNAVRLARNETNLAYKESEQQRWQQMDFVVGYEVKRSNHPYECPDICDKLKGKYPKTLKFRPWHVNCRCFVVPILITDEERRQQRQAILSGKPFNFKSVNEVTDYPEGFKEWIKENKDKIEMSVAVGNTPYFIKDNMDVVEEILYGKPELLRIAEARHKARTPEQIEAIKLRWKNRQTLIDNYDYYDVQSARKEARRLGVDISELEDFISNHELVVDKNTYEIDGLKEIIEKQKDKLQPVRDEWYNKISAINSVKYKFKYKGAKYRDSAKYVTIIDAFIDEYGYNYSNNNEYKPAVLDAYLTRMQDEYDQMLKKGILTEDEYKKRLKDMFSNDLLDRAKKMALSIPSMKDDFIKYFGTDYKTAYEAGQSLQRKMTAIDIIEIRRKALNGEVPMEWYDRIIEMRHEMFSQASLGAYDLPRFLETTDNMLALASNDAVKKFGIHKVSMFQPAVMFSKEFTDIGIDYTKTPIDKRLFDAMGRYLPLKTHLEPGHSGAFCRWGETNSEYVCIPIHDDYNKKRMTEGTVQRVSVVYHEYGHAIDWIRGTRNEDRFLQLFNKWRRKATESYIMKVYNEKHLPYVDEHFVGSNGVVKYSPDFWEEAGNLNDSYMALKKGKVVFDHSLPGHWGKYFTNDTSCYTEFIAHMSENFFLGNKIFEMYDKALYNDMVDLFGKFISEYLK